ncbi:hypothetical protein Z517_00326 [Fonsecaea pedrosoi CBS 271.37]|uniref:Unplaced genomic scaffold supercont1.1, whole genome shotgun sequence n=1 Tax=Fonsecaea pedrosoi CBS 271.37 TaxID=1442368 RepID=A0A0D2GVF7_9EURO|nr:uncharacterized protein Z517_00326 [Fonsecaea pedrosoi CBS 271.37]KIW84938.1 hypothetical protein Z517_00326 [Fonsecaea pedrosoi CBS 271.37]
MQPGLAAVCVETKTPNENHPPPLDLLRSNQRSVSFGKLGEFAGTGSPSQPHQVSLAIEWMLRALWLDVAKGSSESNGNVMTPFTEEMKDWFDIAFRSQSEEHPVDFNKRFVMAVNSDMP